MNAPVEAGVRPYVLTRTQDGVRTLTMNRGERFNALSREMLAALERAIDECSTDASVRAVVIAGAGRGFCAGHDLKELRSHDDPAWQRELFDACSRVMLKLTQLPQPTIARVHGIATAAGCQLVSMCDLAVAADNATFARFVCLNHVADDDHAGCNAYARLQWDYRLEFTHCCDELQSRPNCTLRVLFMGFRVAKVGKHAIPHVSGNKATRAADDLRDAILVG